EAHRRDQGEGFGRRQRHRRRGCRRHHHAADRQGSEQGRGAEGARAARGGVGGAMLQMAEFWVGVAFVVFVVILLYYKVPGLITKALDERAQAIRKELDEARRLRAEAQNQLADYQRKHRRVGQEAEALAHETRTSLREARERRSKAAEEKIARAEPQAVDEVRASAIEVAVTAAEKILRQKMQGSEGAALVDQSIRDLKGRLN